MGVDPGVRLLFEREHRWCRRGGGTVAGSAQEARGSISADSVPAAVPVATRKRLIAMMFCRLARLLTGPAALR